jgi:enoyl-CoA hydratase
MKTVHLSRDGHVLRAVIDKPGDDLNTVDEELHADLVSLFAQLRQETEARAVLLSAQGRAFSAGGDFRWMPKLQDPDAMEHLRLSAKQMIWDLLDIPIPVVAAVNGPAVGLGASISLLCDCIVASTQASFADPHVRVGIVAGDGGTVAWPLAVGPAKAKRYLLTGDPISAVEAERIGLVTDVVPPEELEERSMALAQRLAEGAPLAIRYTKLAVNNMVKQALATSFDLATAYEMFTFKSADHAEALAALREKRPPRFEGR